MKIDPKNSGPATVATMNQRDRTRSRYSRRKTAQNFLMRAAPEQLRWRRVGSVGGHALQEDLVQRRPHELEPLDARACIQQAPEQQLRIGPRRHLDLGNAIRVIGARRKRAVTGCRSQPWMGWRQTQRRPLDARAPNGRLRPLRPALCGRPPMMQTASHTLLGAVHQVGAKNHCAAAFFEVEMVSRECLGVDRIQSAEWLIEDHELGVMKQRANELHLLLHPARELVDLDLPQSCSAVIKPEPIEPSMNATIRFASRAPL